MKTKALLIMILILTVLGTACAPSASACPTATSDTRLLTNTDDGYCLLYPAEHSADWPGWVVINPISGPGDVPGEAWVSIEVQDSEGRTMYQVVDELIAATGPGFNITETEVEVDGSPAMVIDGLPGMDSNRMVIVVRDDRLYTLTFMPWQPGAAGGGQVTALEHLYEKVMQSMHFLPPA